MAKRFTDTDLWDKEWFMELGMKHKLLIKLLFAKCDVAGVWSPNWTLASSYIGEKVNKEDLDLLDKHIEYLPDGRVFVVDFISFQYGVLTEKCAPHRKIIALLKKYGLYERVTVGYRKGIYTLQEKEEDKEEEKEVEEEKEEDMAPRKKFTPPTEHEVALYFAEKQTGVWTEANIYIQASKFIGHYTANGWKVGKNPMKDWKAAVRNWILNNFDNNNRNTSNNGFNKQAPTGSVIPTGYKAPGKF